jgi:hypothetical protein
MPIERGDGFPGEKIELSPTAKREGQGDQLSLSEQDRVELNAQLSRLDTSLEQLQHLQTFVGKENYPEVGKLPGLVQEWVENPDRRPAIIAEIVRIVES